MTFSRDRQQVGRLRSWRDTGRDVGASPDSLHALGVGHRGRRRCSLVGACPRWSISIPKVRALLDSDDTFLADLVHRLGSLSPISVSFVGGDGRGRNDLLLVVQPPWPWRATATAASTAASMPSSGSIGLAPAATFLQRPSDQRPGQDRGGGGAVTATSSVFFATSLLRRRSSHQGPPFGGTAMDTVVGDRGAPALLRDVAALPVRGHTGLRRRGVHVRALKGASVTSLVKAMIFPSVGFPPVNAVVVGWVPATDGRHDAVTSRAARAASPLPSCTLPLRCRPC